MDLSLVVTHMFEACINASRGERVVINQKVQITDQMAKSLEQLGCSIVADENKIVLKKTKEYVAIFEPNSEIKKLIAAGKIDKEKLQKILQIVKQYPISQTTANSIKKYLKKVSTKELYQLKQEIEKNIKIKKEHIA